MEETPGGPSRSVLYRLMTTSAKRASSISFSWSITYTERRNVYLTLAICLLFLLPDGLPPLRDMRRNSTSPFLDRRSIRRSKRAPTTRQSDEKWNGSDYSWTGPWKSSGENTSNYDVDTQSSLCQTNLAERVIVPSGVSLEYKEFSSYYISSELFDQPRFIVSNCAESWIQVFNVADYDDATTSHSDATSDTVVNGNSHSTSLDRRPTAAVGDDTPAPEPVEIPSVVEGSDHLHRIGATPSDPSHQVDSPPVKTTPTGDLWNPAISQYDVYRLKLLLPTIAAAFLPAILSLWTFIPRVWEVLRKRIRPCSWFDVIYPREVSIDSRSSGNFLIRF
jgi:hypothetical protein